MCSRVLRLVQGDDIDAGRIAARRVVHLTQVPAKRDLGLRVEVQAAEDEDAVRLERVEDGRGQGAVAGQAIDADADDLRTHCIGQLLDRDHAHRLSPPLCAHTVEELAGLLDCSPDR